MPLVTVLQPTPGKLIKTKAEFASVPELRQAAAELSGLPANNFRLVWQGIVLKDDFDTTKLANSLVMVVPIAPPVVADVPPPPVTVSDEEAHRFRMAFGSALRNPAFSKVVKRLTVRENMDSLAAACPGLTQDPVAQAFLTRPELLLQLLDPNNLKKIGQDHPSLLEAAHNLAAAVHEEQAVAGRTAGPGTSRTEETSESDPGSYFLDDMSDEEMEEDGGEAARVQTGGRPNPITAQQLAAALSAAAGGGANPFMGITGLGPSLQQGAGSSSASASQSAATTPGVNRVTSDMFAAAMQQALGGAVGGQETGGGSAPSQPPQPDYSAQLATMRDMGIVDEGLATQALTVMGGDIQAAVDLIFSGWLGDDQTMN